MKRRTSTRNDSSVCVCVVVVAAKLPPINAMQLSDAIVTWQTNGQ